MSDSKPVNLNLPDPALYVAFNSDDTAIRFWTCDHLRALNAEMVENLPIREFYSRDHIVRYGSDRHDAGRSAVVCDWHQDSSEHSDTWATSCGNYFVMIDGSPRENLMNFCPFCGKHIDQMFIAPDAVTDEAAT